jgi:hypothetical protein
MFRFDLRTTMLAATLTLFGALPAAAQVGHPPDESPYRDLEYRQELTPYGGVLGARSDRAGVLPRGGALVGLRYQVYIAGPISLNADVSTAFSERDVIDPKQVAAKRLVGTQDVSVYAADVGVALGLTGRKSWHRIVPEVRAGIGLVTTAQQADASGYQFGTPFAFTVGGGLKLVGLGRLQLRADVGERLFKQKYPDSFYVKASDNTAVLENSSRSFWTNHSLATLGVSFLFDR